MSYGSQAHRFQQSHYRDHHRSFLSLHHRDLYAKRHARQRQRSPSDVRPWDLRSTPQHWQHSQTAKAARWMRFDLSPGHIRYTCSESGNLRSDSSWTASCKKWNRKCMARLRQPHLWPQSHNHRHCMYMKRSCPNLQKALPT